MILIYLANRSHIEVFSDRKTCREVSLQNILVVTDVSDIWE